MVDKYMKERPYIPATVPIVVGVVLAAMVLIVIVAYFVGRARQNKKAKKPPVDKTDEIEITVQPSDNN